MTQVLGGIQIPFFIWKGLYGLLRASFFSNNGEMCMSITISSVFMFINMYRNTTCSIYYDKLFQEDFLTWKWFHFGKIFGLGNTGGATTDYW